MNNKAVFAGTFDPFTLGHYEIVKRASEQYDTVYLAVAESNKNCKFSLKKRVRIAQLSVKDLPGVVVVPFKGFLTDFMKENGISVYIRGLRNAIDFEYERNLYLAYKSQNANIKDIPTNLIEAFKSTLESAVFSDLNLIILDATGDWQNELEVTRSTISSLGSNTPEILVFNKCDLVSDFSYYPTDAVFISAKTGLGIEQLKEIVVNKLF